MKNLLISLGGFGAFALGVMLSFDVAGIVGRGLARDDHSPRTTPNSASLENDLQNLRSDWQRIGDDFCIALKRAHES